MGARRRKAAGDVRATFSARRQKAAGGVGATFGARVRRLRMQTPSEDGKPLTQESLARALGVSLFTVSGWERLESSDTLRTASLMALCDFFHVEPRWLARGVGPKRRRV